MKRALSLAWPKNKTYATLATAIAPAIVCALVIAAIGAVAGPWRISATIWIGTTLGWLAGVLVLPIIVIYTLKETAHN